MKCFKWERKLLLLYDFLKMFPFARRGDWTRATRDRHMMIYTNIKFIKHLTEADMRKFGVREEKIKL